MLPRLLSPGMPLISVPLAVLNTLGVGAQSNILDLSTANVTVVTSSETASLPMHLYNQGLLSGKHSDITVHAFGTKYALHRLLLDRAPFFSSALSEPWFESTSKDITLHPEDIDSSITQQAFELALKRIYGCDQVLEEEKEAVGLFATGCWLEMADLVDASVTSLLHQMCPSKLSSMIRLVTNNYYGKPGERILSSAKAMLCREGWEMPIRYWDGIPGDIAREIIGGDGLFVPGEWERWVLAKRVLDRRLRMQAHELGLVDQNGKLKQAPPASMYFSAIRFDTVYQRDSFSGSRGTSEADDPWIVLYTCPDVAALLVLLDEGIHYVHLSFEQLQTIREQRDALGVPILPEKVISGALWMSLELRQKIVNAKDLDMELGLSQIPEDQSDDDTVVHRGTATDPSSSTNAPPNSAGKQPEPSPSPVEDDKEDDEMESGSWDGNGKPRKFWIPNADATSVMGGVQEELPCSSNGGRAYAGRHVSRLSATIDPHDVQWASDFTAAGHERPQTPNRQPIIDQLPPLAYTHYPPFRFSAEFPNVRLLKDKKRVYSRTVWYAGSLWNVYVQKVETPKNTQLGVYLHRAKEREASEDIVVARHGSVDESIGHLERELLLGRRDRSRHRRQVNNTALDIDEDNSGSGGDPDATLVPGSSTDAQRATVLNGLLRGQGITKASQTPGSLMLSNLPDRNHTTTPDTDEDVSEIFQNMHLKVPALSPYVDGRPTIRTYFKIYTPSKGGRVLSVYESAPDKFNFSQSWGWKSSNMVLDDGMLGYDETARSKDGRLRFMVVIGMI